MTAVNGEVSVVMDVAGLSVRALTGSKSASLADEEKKGPSTFVLRVVRWDTYDAAISRVRRGVGSPWLQPAVGALLFQEAWGVA